MTTPPPTARQPRRAGRLPAAERAARREQILRAALEEIAEQGFERATTARIAERAGASKETLYAWFGDKRGLAAALIEANADRAVAVPVPDDVEDGHTLAQARTALCRCARGLLDLLTSRESVALNRAAMASPALAQELRASGRGRTGPTVEQYLARLHELGLLHAPDPGEAFRLLYGLVVQDTQIQSLLGAPRPARALREAQADRAVEHFLTLIASPRPGSPIG
ncbi:TetR/AcrR family transcriptional regulator [Salana multivorans]